METGNGTTVYHLNILEKEGAIVKKGKYYFIRGSTPQLFPGMQRNFREKEQVIVNYLLRFNQSGEQAITSALRIKQSSVNRIMKFLMETRVVVRFKQNGIFLYSLSPAYLQWDHHNQQPIQASTIQTCPACMKEITMPNASFCPYCSTNLRAR